MGPLLLLLRPVCPLLSPSVVTTWIQCTSGAHVRHNNKFLTGFANSCPLPIHSSPTGHGISSQMLKFCPSPLRLFMVAPPTLLREAQPPCRGV